MDINIRNSVKENLKGSTTQEVYQTIQDAISVGEEKVLPGLGVLFELLWQKADTNCKETIVSNIAKAL
jgi:small, acid-soluble spore protein I